MTLFEIDLIVPLLIIRFLEVDKHEKSVSRISDGESIFLAAAWISLARPFPYTSTNDFENVVDGLT